MGSRREVQQTSRAEDRGEEGVNRTTRVYKRMYHLQKANMKRCANSILYNRYPWIIPNYLVPYAQQVVVGRRPTLALLGNYYATIDETGRKSGQGRSRSRHCGGNEGVGANLTVRCRRQRR